MKLKACAIPEPLSADFIISAFSLHRRGSWASGRLSRFSLPRHTTWTFLLWDHGTSSGHYLRSEACLHFALWSHEPSWIILHVPLLGSFFLIHSLVLSSKEPNLLGRKLWSNSSPMFPNLLHGFWDSKAQSQLLCSLLFSEVSIPQGNECLNEGEEQEVQRNTGKKMFNISNLSIHHKRYVASGSHAINMCVWIC